jgi:hypothetical protein
VPVVLREYVCLMCWRRGVARQRHREPSPLFALHAPFAAPGTLREVDVYEALTGEPATTADPGRAGNG